MSAVTDPVPPTELLHQAAAGHDPRRVAIRYHGRSVEELTYGDLDRRSNQLAAALRRNGIRTGDIVALLLDRGPGLLTAQLAVMKAGAAWTVLDPQLPAARTAFQTADCGTPLVLTADDLAERVPGGRPHWNLDDPAVRRRIASEPDTEVAADVSPDDAAYLLYTSGSTGVPKGVLVSHRSVVAYCRNAVEMFGTTPADRVAQVANPAFDMSVFDCHATLLAGATIVSAPSATITDPEALTALLRDAQVSLAAVPPALLALLDPGRLADSALRALDIGGEALGADLVGRWSRPGLALHNAYGPTETTVVCTDYLFPPVPLPGKPPIGTPLPGHRAYVLDKRLRPVPIGVAGQLYVSGAGVAHGYLNRPALTARSFLPDPYGGGRGERMYATGDLARRRSDGVLEYLGRIDRQVKLRGQRIELGEIENALLRHPGVRQCAVVLRDDAYLAAYVVGEAGPGEIRRHLGELLPPYMIPGACVELPELPLTPNGKVDTARLPEPGRPGAEYREPRTDTERWLAGVWRELLGAERVGAGDDFLDLGGTSLLATRLAARIRERLNVELTPRDLFAAPVLDRLAAHLDAVRAETEGVPVPPTGPDDEIGEDLDDEIAALERLLKAKRAHRAAKRQIVPVPRDRPLVCSYQQEGLWFEHQVDPASAAYHIPAALRLRGQLDVAVLERALHALVVRHEALRTRFVADGGVPRQVIDPAPAGLSLPVAEVSEEGLERWVADETGRPMDLAAGPLFRARLGRIAPDEHVLVLVVHHIVADGWSVGILADDLTRLFAAESGLAGARLPELPVQPADHTVWQRARLDDGERENQLNHWRDRLADLPTVDFPADRPRPAHPTGAGASVGRRLPAGLSDEARRYARANRVSFLAVLQAALLTVLHRYTGQDDLPIGSVFSGRTRTEAEAMVGYFVNALVLRTRLDGDPSFAEAVRRCHDTVLDASARQDFPLGLLVDALQPERIAGRNALFQISLTYQPAARGEGELALGKLTAEEIDIESRYARFDIAIEVSDAPDGRLQVSAEYSTELFDADRIERLIDHYAAALATGLAAPDTAVGDLDVLSAAERDRVLHAWNPPPTPEAPGLLHEVSAGHPADRVAIGFEGVEVTYGELEARGNRLARALGSAGIGPGHVVGVLLERGPDLPVAQLAVMKAGAAWTILDPQLPANRLAFQTADAGASIVLTSTDLTALLPAGSPYWQLDDPGCRARIDAEADTPPETAVRPDDPAYLLYTSGSTGNPKGVLVSHRSAHAYCVTAVRQFTVTPADRVAQVSNPAFDASIFDCFAGLLAGATLVGIPRETVADPRALTALLRRERVTLAYLPPAILALLDPAELADSALRGGFSAGEALPVDQVHRWTRPGFALHNCYGPTETTVVVTDYRCPEEPRNGSTPIGTPLANHRAYILDGGLRPMPVGVPGQLFVAGTGVAYGYLNLSALTAQRFLPDPYAPGPGERMYATGDLARWRSDGTLEYLGRLDRQIKLRGQRVELGEIETVLAQHPGVRQSAVVLHGTRLAGYVVGDADLDELRTHLADRLAPYMLPTTLLVLPELPLTPNGKLDTDRLPVPDATAQYLAPRTGTERWLASAWQDVLDVGPVGVHDNFFDLGGNSLHSTQLTARVREYLDVELPSQVLFTDPTLERFAARIDQILDGEDTPVVTDVVVLRPDGTRPPLFLVHASTGTAAPYARLAPMLGDDQPVYAIEDPGLRGAEAADSVPERARQYVDLIRQVRPDGPYRLGGWSFGGAVAFEMARQLTEAGAAVDTVVLVDAQLEPGDDPVAPSEQVLLSMFARDSAGSFDAFDAPLPDFTGEEYQGLDGADLENLALEVLDKAGLLPGALPHEHRTRMRVFNSNARALLTYRYHAARYAGRVVLISQEAAPDETLWSPLCSRLERRRSAGNHYTMMRPPHLAALGATVREVLAGPIPAASADARLD
ncbi:amino acid adenylation domain-containing protein [Streptomyces sp. NPDC021020]|uniref:amino acid adenylation domain-containing protein n=1 Tax=Streptomyces sp. NPDC021020 TaxID=3365109 RepID=UPI0037B44D75